MSQQSGLNVIPEFLSGGGDMGQKIREYDWSKTSLGPVHTWPQSLRTCIRIMLTSRQPIWIGWGKDLIKFYNDPYKTIVGGKHPWALGSPARIVWKDIWKDIEPMLQQVMEMDEGTYAESQLLIMERNGYPEETYYTFSYTPIPGDDGDTAGMICANTDDTDRIISERQLRTLTQLGKSLTDTKTGEEIVHNTIDTLQKNPYDFPFVLFRSIVDNKAVMVHSTPLGQHAAIIQKEIDLDSDSEIARTINKAIATRKIQVFENLTQKIGILPQGAWEVAPDKVIVLPVIQSGRKEPFGILVVGLNPYRLLDEKYISFFTLVTDQVATSFSDVYVLEQERKRAEALAEIDKAKTTFFSNISHEFRTPLTLLLGPIEEVLRDKTTSPDSQVKMDLAYRNALRMQKLVNTLLEFSKIEAGRMEGRFSLIDIGSFTRDLASTFRSAIEKAGMQLHYHSDEITDEIYVDHEMWEKIVLNLISNAFKYSKEGTISVALKKVGDQLELSVSDTGVGIPADQLDKIFDRFHRIENTQGRSQEGTGIGLSMVKELVRLHNGFINVNSQVGKGSVFTITIPTGKDHLPANKIADTSYKAATSSQAEAFVQEAMKWIPGEEEYLQDIAQDTIEKDSNKTYVDRDKDRSVLLADDNADMREYVQRLLSPQFNVIMAVDGEEAFEKLLCYKPDLLLSDVMMPKLDGFGLLNKVRSHPETKNIPVIFLSARAGEEAKIEGLDAGADDYLVKPFYAKELLARVDANIKIARNRIAAENNLRSIIHQSPVAMTLLRGENLVMEIINQRALQLLGKQYDQIINQPVANAFPEFESQGFLDILKNVYASGKPFSAMEMPVKLLTQTNKESRYFNFTSQPITSTNGQVEGIVVVSVDVTEQVTTRKRIEESEKQFKDVLVQSPSIFLILKGRDMVINFANQPLLNSWGRNTDIVGKPLLEVLPELKDQPFPKLLEKVYNTGIPHYGYEEKAVLIKEGVPQDVYYNYVYQPNVDGDDSISGVTIMASDITEQVIARKKIEDSEKKYRELTEELEVIVEKRTEELRRSNDDLQQFAHVTSHDLKEPVRKFQTFMSILEDEYGNLLPAKGKNYLAKMQHASERMSSMIEGVLNYSLLNEKEHVIQNINLSELIANIEEDLEVMIHQKNAEIKIESLPEIEGSPVLLYQLFYNLIYNSLKFSKPDEPPVINISASPVQQKGIVYTEIVMTDNGIGFDSMYAEKIFDTFTRLHSKDKYEGTGLGLALCKKIAERHHGSISASGAKGQGASFTIWLPLTQEEEK